MLKKYNLPIWYLATLLFTGALLLPHFIWEDAGNYSISFTQFGPLFATILLIKLMRDSDAKDKIKRGLLFNPRCILWYVLSVVIPFGLTGISTLIITGFFNSQCHAWNGTFVFYFLNLTAMILGSIGEEIGWRGYLLPSLNRKTSPFISSIIVGFLWGFWHLNYAGDVVFWLLFIVTTIESSILFTFLLNKANGNLWTAIIFHTFFNLANRVFVWKRFTINLLLIEIVIFGLTCAFVLVLDRKLMFMSKLRFTQK
jgi:membrane protease YdiL (CAAX protease family)